ncbi:MAG: hypothetical protein LKF52_01065 [Butyrivibrio sp.]|jgi:hypothetical protein|nr:hypothetical protein [Butyrivibrio sp.]
MKLTYVGQKLTVSEYLYLRESVGWKNPCRKQQEKALEMSLFTLTAYDDGMPVGMGRIIGDGIYDTIADVIVLPDLAYTEGITDSGDTRVIFVPVPDETDKDEMVLTFCYYQERKVSKITERPELSDSIYLRKKVIGNLEKNGYLTKDKVS